MRLTYIGFMIFITFALISGCSNDQNSTGQTDTKLPVSENYFIFDTIVNVKVYDESVTEEHFNQIRVLMEKINETMNRFEEGSEVASINDAAGTSEVVVSPETFNIIQIAKSYGASSSGRFDPTIGPLVDLWAIGNGGSQVPASSKIQEAKALVDYTQLTLDEGKRSVKLEQAGMTLDLGAIAKGYAADVIARYLQEQGFHSAIIDLGGNILAMGNKPDGSPWTIGIQSPEETRGAYLGTLPVRNKTIVTSGVYERYFIDNDQLYHHVLDPFTGYPASNDLASVTIITDSSMHADAMSTTTFLLGLEDGLAFIEGREDSEAIFVTADHKVYVTSGLKDDFKLTREDYQYAN